MDPDTFLNSMLAAGAEVLVSTTFGTGTWGKRGGGHVVLVTGTVDCSPCAYPAPYVVDDPAGAYTGSADGHYGPGQCGYQVIYPSDFMSANIRYPAPGRPALAIFPTPGADPPTLLVTNDSSGPAPQFWLEESNGQKTGWTGGPDGQADIPNSALNRDPIIPSDPNAPAAGYDPNAGPQAILLNNPGPDVTLHISSATGGPFQLDLRTYQGPGTPQNKIVTGSLSPGQEQAFSMNGTAVTSAGTSTSGGGQGTCGSNHIDNGEILTTASSHSAACSGLAGVRRKQCLAKQTYTQGLTSCNQKRHGHSKASKAKDTACRKKVATTYHRTLAEITCSQIKNEHKRATCMARARKTN